jgi:hypothetical protein
MSNSRNHLPRLVCPLSQFVTTRRVSHFHQSTTSGQGSGRVGAALRRETSLVGIWRRSSCFAFFVLAEPVAFCAVGAEEHARGRLVDLAAGREVAVLPTSEFRGVARQ